MIRGVTVAVGGAAILLAGLTGCSADKKSEYTTSDTGTQATASASAGSVSASASAGTAKVSIDGKAKDVQGQVVCASTGGNFTIAIGGAATGIAVVMSEDASKVVSVGLGNVDGVALAFQEGAPGASASTTKDGKAYKITGTASGVDMANPMEPITKPFEIDVTCP